MRRRTMAVCGASALAVAAVLIAAPRADAGAVPHYLSVQGVLSDSGGTPITGSRNMTFRIYTVASGGADIWNETQAVTLGADGRYTVLLGLVTALDLPFDQDYWLSIDVAGDGEMTPRYQIASSAYAYNAETVNGIPAEASPTPNALLPLDGTGKFPTGVLDTGTSTGQLVVLVGSDQLPAVDGSLLTNLPASTDADTVDGIHASATPVADQLLALDGALKFPNSVLHTGAGNGLDADTVDGQHASEFAGSAHSHALDELSDVSAAAPQEDDVLTRQGGSWVAAPPPPNVPPVALLTASRDSFFIDQIDVTFDASFSYDPENAGPLQYAWDYLGNGVFTPATPDLATPTYAYPAKYATYLPAVRVQDAAGNIAESKVLVQTGGAWQTVLAGKQAMGISLAVVNGKPAISYGEDQGANMGPIKFAINENDDGSGAWSVYTVDPATYTSPHTSLAVVTGYPAVAYHASGELKYAICDSVGGSDTWAFPPAAVDTSGGTYCSLAVVNGKPAISYHSWGASDLKFAICQLASGTGTWDSYPVDSVGNVGWHTSLAVVGAGDEPGISYYDASNQNLNFAFGVNVASVPGTWNTYAVDSAGNVGRFTSLAMVAGTPAITYYVQDATGSYRYARCRSDDGSDIWDIRDVDTDMGTMPMGDMYTSLAVVGGVPAVAYWHIDTALKYAISQTANGLTLPWFVHTVDDTDYPSHCASLAVVNGRPAIAYSTRDSMGVGVDSLRFVIEP